MNKLSFILFILLITSCKGQQQAHCNMEDEWLKKLVENKEKAAVFKFDNQGSVIIEFHHCFNCPDAVVSFYDCNGNKICDQGGFLGSNNCPEFTPLNKVKIFP